MNLNGICDILIALSSACFCGDQNRSYYLSDSFATKEQSADRAF